MTNVSAAISVKEAKMPARRREKSFFSVTDGEKCSAAHAEPQKDRGEKGHQRIRRANGCQRDGTEKTTDNERVGYIVKLLQQIAGDHGQSKPEHCAGDAAGSQIQNTSGRLV